MSPRLSLARQPPWLLPATRRPQHRLFTVLGIETSCDETSVALLHAPKTSAPQLLYHRTVTSANREYRGVHPMVSLNSHRAHLAPLIQECLSLHPDHRPNLIAATRGPGMAGALSVGYDSGQGLSIGLGVPFVGVHHMLAHLLTARMVHALESGKPIPSDKIESQDTLKPRFPFLTLLVSGGHTMLLSSRSFTTHRIVANTIDIAIGDMLDKAARDVLPASIIDSAPGNASNPNAICYGQLLEDFCFPQGGSPEEYAYYPPGTKERKKQTKELQEKYGDWKISEPLKQWAKPDRAPIYSFVGMGSEVKRAVEDNKIPEEDHNHRRAIGREAMIRVFEHVISRVVMALKSMAPEERAGVKELVISGGVASNKFLRYLAKEYLKSHGFGNVKLVTPPPRFCTDNAAMIAWTGLEMWREGWETELGVFPIRKWSLDSDVEGSDVKGEDVVAGLFGADGWKRRL